MSTDMMDPLRQEVAKAAHTVVIKVGTRVLTRADGTLNDERIAALAEQLNAVNESGRRVVLVSSGAVGAGMSHLGLVQRPTDLAKLQAVAAVGQTKLIEAYDRTFREHGRHAAQVLLTADDLDDRARYLNVRNTLTSLLELDVIPIINENDTVAVDELMITFGDNDRLAALVTNLLRVPLLVILSDVDGLYSGDPVDRESQLIDTVTSFDEVLDSYVQGAGSSLGTGGMASKLRAARIVTAAGENVIIAGGRRDRILERILSGETEGTLFLAEGRSVSSKKRWIGFSAKARGRIFLDAGARRAICERGTSLLAVGVLSAEGPFRKGDVVALCDRDGHLFARGLSNYSAQEIERIKGLRSDKIAQVLGRRPYDEVIHRDNLAVL
ncbi:MAG: glutamate 5-kinase [Pirellulaceae bacterium]